MQPHRKGHQSKNKNVQKRISRGQRRAVRRNLNQFCGKVPNKPIQKVPKRKKTWIELASVLANQVNGKIADEMTSEKKHDTFQCHIRKDIQNSEQGRSVDVG